MKRRLRYRVQFNPVLENSSSKLLRNLAKGKLRDELVVHITLRAKKFDEYSISFFKKNPDGILVNIGCGMDSRFLRVDNGKMTCFDLDLPEMIEFKKQFYEQTDPVPSSRHIRIRLCLDGSGRKSWKTSGSFHG